jgi:hypothetical protein
VVLTLLVVAVGGILLGGTFSLHRQGAPRAAVVVTAVLALGAFALAARIAP